MTSSRLIVLLVPAVLALCAAPLAAQTVEVGGSIAASCIGSDGSMCSESGLFTAGPAASVWLGDRVEVGARVIWFELRDLNSSLTGPVTFDVATIDRERRIAQGEVIWHFRRGRRIRPLLGFGYGRYWRRQVRTCAPEGCEAALGPGYDFGPRETSDSVQSIVTGLSVLLHPRVRVRGGFRYHNPFKDELAVAEYFVGLGYRIGGL